MEPDRVLLKTLNPGSAVSVERSTFSVFRTAAVDIEGVESFQESKMKVEGGMSDRFTKALQHLGHVYEQWPNGARTEGVRHIEKLFVPTGDVLPICGADASDGHVIACPALWSDANCERCLAIEGIPAGSALTKRRLMLDLVNINCNIEQMFLDAMYWNFHNPQSDPINPDPDGVLAKAWADNQQQLIQMMARFEPTMKRHEGRFGWPTELDYEL